MTTPILLLGAGRMGGALIEGWSKAGAFAAADLIVRDPHVDADAFPGAIVNPPLEASPAAKTVLLAVKPQIWREAVADVVPHLAPDAVIVSIAAGVRAADISARVRRPRRGAGHADHRRRHRPGHGQHLRRCRRRPRGPGPHSAGPGGHDGRSRRRGR